MRRGLLGVPAAAVAGVLALAACTSGDAGIRIERVGRATVTEVVDAPASVTARASATVAAPADGRLARLYVANGQRITAGTVLARIDSPAAQQRLAQAQQAVAAADTGRVRIPGVDISGAQAQTDVAARAAFAAAQAAAALIPDPAARAAALARLAATEQQYSVARAQTAATIRSFNAGLAGLGAALRSLGAAQRSQAQAALALATSTVDALTLEAPIDGTVQLGGTAATGAASGLGNLLGQLPGAVQAPTGSTDGGATSSTTGTGTTDSGVSVGMIVSTGTPVATLLDVSSLGLLAEVDETDILLVKPGVRARVELDALPGATFDAVVQAVDLSPTTSSRGGVGYRVRLRLGRGTGADGGPAPQPRPGMSAVAHLAVRTAADALAVPAAAVVRAGSRDAVWVVETGRARRRYVTLGTQGEDLVAVTAGLDGGQRVVVRGADRVRAGQRVP